jgi:DNA-binding MarR family transcriptional regulator
VLVELTDAGRDAVAEAKAHARARWRELAGRFDDDELEETERALRRLAAAIEAD